jgi:hypothetical protein
MKAATLSKVLAITAVSLLSLAGGAAQAGESCVLSALTHSTTADDSARSTSNCREAKHVESSNESPDLIASIAPMMGTMAKQGMRTASTVMRALAREANQLTDE